MVQYGNAGKPNVCRYPLTPLLILCLIQIVGHYLSDCQDCLTLCFVSVCVFHRKLQQSHRYPISI